MEAIRCLRCGHAMVQQSCKVKCPRCQLFYDCSDGMLPMPEGEPCGAAEGRPAAREAALAAGAR